MAPASPLPHQAVRSLRSEVRGAVLTADDSAYAERCAGWNLLRSHNPAVIVVAHEAADVAAATRVAVQHRVGLGVQCTGHGMAVPVEGVLVDTSGLTGLQIDPRQRTAQVGAGCTWGAVLEAAHPHGLAPLLGSSPTVGAVGYTLGGGLGWLARKHGAACDAVRSFEVVTPDGRVGTASNEEQPELFRALRGGGGAFGVVTAMEIDLVAVGPVYAGNLCYPPEAAGDLTEAYAAWVTDLPDELTSSLVYMNVPPAPELPEEQRGRSFVILRGCWSGDIDDGRAILDTWRAEHRPVVDGWATMAFSECASISADRIEPTPVVVAGEWLSRLDRQVGDRLARTTFTSRGPSLLLHSEVRHLGGAVAGNDRTATSFGHRDFPFFLNMVGPVRPAGSPAQSPAPGEVSALDEAAREIRDHQRAVVAALGDAATGAAYLNYLDQDERRTRTGDAFEPDDRVRLAELQQRLDPQGALRYGVDHVGFGRR